MPKLVPGQKHLFDPGESAKAKAHSSTFSDNLSLPIHRWFRYSAGFSATWARELIQRERSNGRCRVLDPFAGSGTTLLEAENCGVEAIGLEAHPFVARIAQAKLHWRVDPQSFREFARGILRRARESADEPVGYPALIAKCFPSEALCSLHRLRTAWEQTADGSPTSELAWLALVSILRECSPAGTAQWQYVLPKKSKAQVKAPFDAFAAKVRLMASDMQQRQKSVRAPGSVVQFGDARRCHCIEDRWADLVITSPPYANNYDYADATRLEMSFMGEIRGWGDLQEAVRRHLVRSCTQHVAKESDDSYELLQCEELKPIRRELEPIWKALEIEREGRGGKKPYHAMIVSYFSDLSKVFQALRRCCTADALLCFVIGDSAPYGIYVPVDRWLGELAVAAGFRCYRFEKTRDRNIKWKNRKHRVPLHEGRLWIEG